MRNSSHQLERTPIGPLIIPKDETGSSIYFKSSCDGIHMGFSNIKILKLKQFVYLILIRFLKSKGMPKNCLNFMIVVMQWYSIIYDKYS